MSNIGHDIQRYFQQQAELYPQAIYLNRDQNQGHTQKNEAEQTKASSDPLAAIQKSIQECSRCQLAKTCNNKVPGQGPINAKLMLVGEAPGQEEDKTGQPFVGKSGQLLDKILAAIELDREQVFISNIVKCRPPQNRNPQQAEIENCIGHLEREIATVNPSIIVALGRTAANALLGTQDSLKNLRQQEHEYEGIILIPTYHPAALLQNPKYKRPTWEDFKKIKKLYCEE